MATRSALSEEMDGAPGQPEREVVHLGSALVWGGVVIRPDGSTAAIPDHEALAVAIAHWVHLPEHLDDTVATCLDVVTRPEPLVRTAAVSAFGAIARRYARMPREQAVRSAVARALQDPVNEVRQAATMAQRAIDQVLGA
jgi:hypothetical protein